MSKENLIDSLFFRWQQTVQAFGVDRITAKPAFDDLVLAYSSCDRYYHTLQHIYSVLNTIDILKIYLQDLPSVQLAAWFHDVVHNTQAQDNEEKSAEYAAEMLPKLAIPANQMTKVKNLILCTKKHQADNIDGQVLLDADLAILGAAPIDYQVYAKAIRQEYAWVEESEYITGRRKVLEQFLQRQSIYSTPLMLESFEELARLNLQAELKTLFSSANME
ncbi:hypothetical protein A0J48_006235 [Sphaerospermopsis aphanizomenoides BCCUSP55]|uniref:HD domain-containing protein n=1 Tax=Sphaerospermopsis aphanizomenoides TaxID=459663 RepID=UPI000A993CCE|nr:hypothetical protein [Sphaerospermopsis aphanizomenoides]MBK1987139.1 hypothetical protein [Sphaerospermopsis aphanizomenoides BCCUSP55]